MKDMNNNNKFNIIIVIEEILEADHITGVELIHIGEVVKDKAALESALIFWANLITKRINEIK